MNHLQWYDYLRLVCATLALLASFFLFLNHKRIDKRYSETVWFLQAFLALTIYGQIEQVHQNVPLGFRTFLTSTLVICCFIAAVRHDFVEEDS
jgi:hypothetical protein